MLFDSEKMRWQPVASAGLSAGSEQTVAAVRGMSLNLRTQLPMCHSSRVHLASRNKERPDRRVASAGPRSLREPSEQRTLFRYNSQEGLESLKDEMQGGNK